MSQTNPNQKPPNQNQKQQIITKAVVPIIVAIVGGTGFWQLIQWIIQNRNDDQVCQIKADDISLAKTVIEANQSLDVSIRADNPDGKPLLYNWQAVRGKMNPGLRSGSTQSTYTAPSDAVDDTISVDVTLPGCKPVRRSKPIAVVLPSSSTLTPTPLKMSTLVPSTPPSNSSPSPKPTQQNRVVYQQKFEGDLVTTNDCDPKDSELTEGGHNGRGLKVTNNNKIWGCRSFQLPKVYEAGKTYQASVWCKADKEAKCQLFFGEPHKVDQEALNNESKVILQGNGDWQKIITNPIKIRPDKYVVVQVYSIEVPGKSVIFDDILVEEVIN